MPPGAFDNGAADKRGMGMSYAASPSAERKIDIGASVRVAYSVVMENSRLAIELVWLPFAIVVVAEIIALLLGGGGFFGRAFASLVRAVAFLVFGTTFIARWHRSVLLGENESAGLFPPGWNPCFWAFVKIGLTLIVGFVILGFIAVVPPHLLTVPLAIIGGIALTFASARVSLVFPAAAVERPISLREAWELMAGNYWRLFVCLLLCFLPFGVVHHLLDRISFGLSSLLWLVFQVVGLAVVFAGMAVVASLLSHIYREFDRPLPAQRAA
jgi:hypothetical protein